MGWLFNSELVGFKRIGRGVKISRHALIYGSENVSIGDNVRIDAGVKILANKGEIVFGSHIHVACNAIFVCGGGIHVGDFVPISFGCQLISASDSYCGDALVGPVFDPEYTSVKTSPIVLERLSGLGANCVILPGVRLREGAVAGACSLLTRSTEPWKTYVGQPARAIGDRDKRCAELAVEWEEKWKVRKV